MTKKLEACPFCGSEDVQLVTTEQPWVVCKNCRAEININCNYDQQVVIDKWNTRPLKESGLDIAKIVDDLQEDIPIADRTLSGEMVARALSAHFSPVKGMEVSVEEIAQIFTEECLKIYGLEVTPLSEQPDKYQREMRTIAKAVHAKLSAQPGRGTESR